MTIIVDSDALIGLLNKDDSHYLEASKILAELIKREDKLIYPSTTIAESSAVLQVRLKKPELSKEIINLLLDGKLIIEPVDEDLLKKASALLKPGRESSHNTLFDGIVAAAAKKNKTKMVFSFDKWYKKLGLTLASSLAN